LAALVIIATLPRKRSETDIFITLIDLQSASLSGCELVPREDFCIDQSVGVYRR
jgi:hypothetical protein